MIFSRKIKLNLITISILVLFVFLAVGSSPESENKINEPTKTTAAYRARDYLEQRLTAPLTADYPFWSEDKDTAVKELENNKFGYRSYVHSENAFGVEMRTDFYIVVKYIGNENWRLVSIDTW